MQTLNILLTIAGTEGRELRVEIQLGSRWYDIYLSKKNIQKSIFKKGGFFFVKKFGIMK